MARIRGLIYDNSTGNMYTNTISTATASVSQRIGAQSVLHSTITIKPPGQVVQTTTATNAPFVQFAADSTLQSIQLSYANSTGGTTGSGGSAVTVTINKTPASTGVSATFLTTTIPQNTITTTQITSFSNTLFSAGDKLSAVVTVGTGIAPQGLRINFNYYNQQ
jgi:hypothetical protein